MSLIVALTAGAGFLASGLLRSMGLDQMWLRYAVCVAVAFVGVFLLLIGLWRRWREWDLSLDIPNPGSNAGNTSEWAGQGGSSGGGGASASFEALPVSPPIESADVPDLPDVDIDLGDGIWLLPVLLVAAGMLIAAIWLIWIAPPLMAEVAVDAALSAGLYRRLRYTEADDWFFATLRHTWKPFLLAAICAVIIGAIFGHISPEATTLGEAISHFSR